MRAPGPVDRALVDALGPSEDDDARHRARAADVVREPELGVLHLTRAGLVAQLGDALVDHPHAARPDRVAERLEPAARVHGDVAFERGPPLLREPAAVALLAEAEVLRVGDLRPREAVVDLGEVDVARRDAGHRVRLARSSL